MPARFTIRYQAGEVIEVLTLLEASYEDPTPLMQDVLLIMIRSTQLTFQAQGRPDKWAKLSPATIRARLRQLQRTTGRRVLPRVRADGRRSIKNDQTERSRRLKYYRKLFGRSDKYYTALGSIQILRDRGLLAQSVGGSAAGPFEAAEGFGEVTRTSAIIGTNRPGSDALQRGNPERNLPARPFLLIQVQDEVDVADIGIQFMLRTGPYAA